MADITITGCVDWTTGKLEFDMDSDCDSGDGPTLEGCIERDSGENFGKVKVVITGRAAACNGTYYGCVDWTTGKFEIDIPEECCYATSCAYCDTDLTPQFVTVRIAGVADCSCATDTILNAGYADVFGCIQQDAASISTEDAASNINGDYILVQTGGDECRWEYSDTEEIGTLRKYVDSYCADELYNESGCTQKGWPLNNRLLYLVAQSGELAFHGEFGEGGIIRGDWDYNTDDDCMEPTGSEFLVRSTCSNSYHDFSSATFTIIDWTY